MSCIERLKEILPDLADKSRVFREQSRRWLREFQATNPEEGKVTQIRLDVGRNLKSYGIEDPETNQLVFVGYSQPGRFNLSGLPPEVAVKVEGELEEMDPKFLVVASAQLPQGLLEKTWKRLSGPPTIQFKWSSLTIDYSRYPLHLEMLLKKLTKLSE